MFRNIMEVVFPYDLITQFEIDHLGAKAKLEIFSRCKSSLDDADRVIGLDFQRLAKQQYPTG